MQAPFDSICIDFCRINFSKTGNISENVIIYIPYVRPSSKTRHKGESIYTFQKAIMRFITTLVLFCFAIICKSQDIDTVQYTIVDSISQNKILNGKYVIVLSNDTICAGTFFDGRLMVPKHLHLMEGSKLVIDSENYLIYVQDLNPADAERQERIVLKKKDQIIEEIVVMEKRSLITSDIDKITYNVQLDEESKFLSLLYMIQKLPLISLDVNENPLFKGKSNFLVLLDNRKSSLFSSNNLREALRSIPAANILKIEVINDPPARYESEGYAGVINIVTLKRSEDGYNGSVNLNTSNFISSGSTSLNLKKGRFGINFFGGVNFERTGNNLFDNTTSSPTVEFYQNGHKQAHSTPVNSSFLLSYELDSLNLFTANFGILSSISKLRTDASATYRYKELATEVYSFLLHQRTRAFDYDANISYQKNFKSNKNNVLSLMYRHSANRSDMNFKNVTQAILNHAASSIMQDTEDSQMGNSLQVDYVQVVKKLTIETGAIYTYRQFESNFWETASYNEEGQPQLFEEMNFNQKIFGLYNSYLLRLRPFSVRFGLRYENTTIDGGALNGLDNAINQNYNNILPSLKIRYQAKDKSLLDLGFNQRVRRPGIALLSPFEIKTNPGFVRTGNPDLKPVLFNNISLGYSKYAHTSLTAMLNYTFSSNTIQSLTAISDTLVLTSYENIGKYQRIGTDLNFEAPLLGNLDLSIDGSISYVFINTNNGANSLKNAGIEAFIFGYLIYKPGKDWRITANMGFSGPTVNVQAKSNSYFYNSFGVSKQIIDGKVNVSVRIVNPFQADRIQRSTLVNSNLTQVAVDRIAFRSGHVSLSWNFGKLKKSVLKVRKSIELDDKAEETGKI